MTTEADIRSAIAAAPHISALQPIKAAIKAHAELAPATKAALLGTLADREDEIAANYNYAAMRNGANRRRGVY